MHDFIATFGFRSSASDLYGVRADEIVDRYGDGDMEGGRPKSRMSLNYNTPGSNRGSDTRLAGRIGNGDFESSDQDEIDGVIGVDSGDDARNRRARNGDSTRPASGRPHRVR